MDVEKIVSLSAEIANGIKKSSSRFRNEPDFDETWDRMTEEIVEIKRKNPDAVIELPNEWGSSF